MARCFKCNREIPLSWIWKKRMVHTPVSARRYFHRVLGLPFFYCPGCGTEIQPSAVTMFVYTLIVAGGTLGSVLLLGAAGGKEKISIFSITAFFILFMFLGNLWWKLFGKLKEPFVFPWEKNCRDKR